MYSQIQDITERTYGLSKAVGAFWFLFAKIRRYLPSSASQ